jgi:hypothetical protein
MRCAFHACRWTSSTSPSFVARVALEPAVALKNLLHDFKESSSLVDRWSA